MKNCFCCNGQLEEQNDVDPGFDNFPQIPPHMDTINPVYSGLRFRATGNFGSTIFDPPGGEILEILICDECIRRKTKQVTWLQITHDNKTITARDVFAAPKRRSKEKLTSDAEKRKTQEAKYVSIPEFLERHAGHDCYTDTSYMIDRKTNEPCSGTDNAHCRTCYCAVRVPLKEEKGPIRYYSTHEESELRESVRKLICSEAGFQVQIEEMYENRRLWLWREGFGCGRFGTLDTFHVQWKDEVEVFDVAEDALDHFFALRNQLRIGNDFIGF